MKWKLIQGDAISATLSVSGDYVISHRPEQFNVSFRPHGHHVHVGLWTSLRAAKRGAEAHAANVANPISLHMAVGMASGRALIIPVKHDGAESSLDRAAGSTEIRRLRVCLPFAEPNGTSYVWARLEEITDAQGNCYKSEEIDALIAARAERATATLVVAAPGV